VEKDDLLSNWLGPSVLPDERLEVLNQQQYVQSLFQKQQEAEALPTAVWLLLGAMALQLESLQQQLKSQQQRLEVQQRELDTLKRLQEHPSAEVPAVPDAFQRWMMDHRAELARQRGRHIAVHFEEGIVASAESYASLVDDLERRSIPDDHVVIEFIPPTFSSK
jgi:hypothetical protein